MIEVIDQTGFSVSIPTLPQRIISLVPSQTELLYDLALDDRVVGITKFCIHPDHWFRNKIRVGGTKTVNIDIVRQLQPDLIIANKEENTKEDIELLRKEFNVWTSDILTLEEALKMISSVGVITGTPNRATEIKLKIENSFKKLTQGPQVNVLYLIWSNPWMCAGDNTFINDLISKCGWNNLGTTFEGRYPQLTDAQIAQCDPDIILLSSEPFPFKEQHIQQLKIISPGSRIMEVDGELFSWYGSRLLHTVRYLNELNAAWAKEW
jgi:ABC-type Fe3+-hydroxamate transport system substrate-binding protein